ncbi:MAG: hypothetical protein ACPGJV_08195 [Bacteriovoracaceae bacterium]
MSENWVSLVEYVHLKKSSISTVRRRIRSGKIQSKLIKGKYYLLLKDQEIDAVRLESEKEILELKLENHRLLNKLRQTEQEKNDLEMLIALYEKQNLKNAQHSGLELETFR